MASVLEFERASATLSDTANMVFKLRNPVATQKLQDDITVLRKQSTTFYDSEISRLMDMVQYLQASQIRTRNMLDHAQYARSPIARLLIENLSLIFLFVNNNPPKLVLGEMTRNHKAAHADVAGLRHVCREWKHIVASIPELHHIVVNIDPYWSPPRTNFWLNAHFIESTDDTPIDWVIHPWEFHDGFHDTYSSKRCECEWTNNWNSDMVFRNEGVYEQMFPAVDNVALKKYMFVNNTITKTNNDSETEPECRQSGYQQMKEEYSGLQAK
ncbi:hypothetical protein FISHEDRAFT_56481 [Fistulina hepatica ATCC 64428]|uniref:F-box domain-containing protein n=1 Tax=Fistulina hepatica ATCC 64428 TaxID=1128425 RepID=A0A0D7AIX9_9AGAR|nr:hypothetical protein FISHEDRAFT_56481 [Fistulina hepatica ATCC 64428]